MSDANTASTATSHHGRRGPAASRTAVPVLPGGLEISVATHAPFTPSWAAVLAPGKGNLPRRPRADPARSCAGPWLSDHVPRRAAQSTTDGQTTSLPVLPRALIGRPGLHNMFVGRPVFLWVSTTTYRPLRMVWAFGGSLSALAAVSPVSRSRTLPAFASICPRSSAGRKQRTGDPSPDDGRAS